MVANLGSVGVFWEEKKAFGGEVAEELKLATGQFGFEGCPKGSVGRDFRHYWAGHATHITLEETRFVISGCIINGIAPI